MRKVYQIISEANKYTNHSQDVQQRHSILHSVQNDAFNLFPRHVCSRIFACGLYRPSYI